MFVAVKTTLRGSLYFEHSFPECFGVVWSKRWSSVCRAGKRRQKNCYR